MLKYASLEFQYSGATSFMPGNRESDTALRIAEKAVDRAAVELGVEMVHEYSWPDGSLYRVIRAEDPTNVAYRIQALADKHAKSESNQAVSVYGVSPLPITGGCYHTAAGDVPMGEWFDRRISVSGRQPTR